MVLELLPENAKGKLGDLPHYLMDLARLYPCGPFAELANTAKNRTGFSIWTRL